MAPYDLAGIGIGPFNLSLAALAAPLSRLRTLFLERRAGFAWHPDQLLPGARLQTSFLKDLVTPVDPTSPYSFLNYVRAKRRFYEFLNADQPAILRAEFADYLAWVAARLPSLRFSAPIETVRLDGRRLRLEGPAGRIETSALVVGTGKQPFLPRWARAAPPERCLHSSATLSAMPDLAGRRVAIVGGGQSGAELFLAIAQGRFGAAAELAWISRRTTFAALDETHFVNEWFTPGFVERFHGLDLPQRQALAPQTKLAGDGISIDTLRAIYGHLYERRHVVGDGHRLLLLPGREVTDLHRDGPELLLEMTGRLDGARERLAADLVVLATGFDWRLPDCLAELGPRLERDPLGRPVMDLSYRLRWDGPPEARLYLQNGAEHSHGIADPQLSLMAWRAATIVNDVLGEEAYDLAEQEPIVRWQPLPEPAPPRLRRLA